MTSHVKPSRIRSWLRAGSLAGAGAMGTAVLLGLPANSFGTALQIHYLGLAILFTFLLLGTLSHLFLFISSRINFEGKTIPRAVRFWWILTDLLPGPAAILILCSGFRLTLEGNHSLGSSWLLVLVIGFGFFAADGVLAYSPRIATLDSLASRPDDPLAKRAIAEIVRSPRLWGLVMVHFCSFLVLFIVGRCKVGWQSTLLRDFFRAVDDFLVPIFGRWAGVVTALATVTLSVALAKLFRRK